MPPKMCMTAAWFLRTLRELFDERFLKLKTTVGGIIIIKNNYN